MHNIELCDVNKCTQCLACVNVCPKGCISMVPSKDGFQMPSIDRNECVECGMCLKSCHRISSNVEYRNPLRTFACWTKNVADRENSSSGGAFSVLAKQIISSGGVVFGATMDKDLKVRHIFIEQDKDIHLLQGSKYIQSYLGDVYKQVRVELQKERKVLFTGTPCQIGGLLSYLRKSYENLITCDMVCHGVPSQSAFDIYIEKIGIKSKCDNFKFRFTKGWGYQLSSLYKTKSKLIVPSKAYYLRAFTKGLMFNESCYSCPYARPERISDITLADYWGLGKNIPFDYPKKKGVSLMLVNSKKGLDIINTCQDLFLEERPLVEAVEGNYNLSHSSERPIGRDSYFEDSQKMPISELSRKYGISATLKDYLRIIKQKFNSFV